VNVVPVDCTPFEAAQLLIDVGARSSEKDGRVRAVMYVPRGGVAGAAQGITLSNVIAALRVLPGPGEGPYRRVVDREEVVALIVPKGLARGLANDGEQLVARCEHDDGCRRLRPNAPLCSCSCDATLSVVAEPITR